MRHILITLIALAGLALTGCVQHKPAQTSHFLLSSPAKQQVNNDVTGELYIAPVELPQWLDGYSIAYQNGEHQVSLAKQNLWAQPLAKLLQAQLKQAITQKFPNLDVHTSASSNQDSPVLHMQLQKFHGNAKGQALVSGQWQLKEPNKKSIYKVDFTAQQPLEKDGYPALVDALDKAWQSVLDKLIKQLGQQL